MDAATICCSRSILESSTSPRRRPAASAYRTQRTGNNFAVSGNRPQQNLFLLNGVEFTGAAENNMQPGGPSQNLLGVEAVREFNVLRDSYGAEYGKRPGAQVTIVTQSGTNQWHGSVYEFLRNNALDAPNYFDQGSAPPFQRNQFGAALGGPIQKRQDIPLRELRRLPPEPASDFGRVCARSGLARGSGAERATAAEPVAHADRQAILTSMESRRFSAALCRPFARTSEQPGSTTPSPRKTTSRRCTPSTTAAMSRDNCRSIQHRHSESARAGAQPGGDACFLAHTAEHAPASVIRVPATSLLASPHQALRQPAFLAFSVGHPWARWWLAEARRRIRRPRSDWQEATTAAI